MNSNFPFTAITAQEDFKLALLLCMIDPTLGGVLVLGDKGTGKTTTVRALHNLMKNSDADFSFVNLPIGATEDRVLGSVKLDVLLTEKRIEIHKGLLSKANNGVLYIDEINLLNDYLMDVLLDAASSGGYYLERDSVSQWLESKFCLVGTMNPEEGALRPQLLDRFGLSVTVKTPTAKNVRMQITNQRLNFDADPVAFTEQYNQEEQNLSSQIQAAKTNLLSVTTPAHLKEKIAGICIEQQVEGLRADILWMKAARANAAFNNKKEVTIDDIEQVKDFVLAHRSKANSQNQEKSQQAPPADQNNGSGSSDHAENESGLNEYLLNTRKTQQYVKIDSSDQSSKKGLKLKAIDKLSGSKHPGHSNRSIDLLETVKTYLIHDELKLSYKGVVSKSEVGMLFIIDSSSSMLQNKQVAMVKGIIEQTALQHKNRKINYSAIALANGTANVVTHLTTAEGLTSSVKQLRTGGKTNLKAGLRLIHQLLKGDNGKNKSHHLFILTDGQVNAGESENPFHEAVAFYKTFLKQLVRTTIVDMEKGFVKLGLAKQLADQLHSHYQLAQ